MGVGVDVAQSSRCGASSVGRSWRAIGLGEAAAVTDESNDEWERLSLIRAVRQRLEVAWSSGVGSRACALAFRSWPNEQGSGTSGCGTGESAADDAGGRGVTG